MVRGVCPRHNRNDTEIEGRRFQLLARKLLFELVVDRDGPFSQRTQSENMAEFSAIVIIKVVDNGGI